MRFFDTNYLFTSFGNTITESSGTGTLAFDEKTRYGWTSSGENTDGDTAWVDCVLPTGQSIDRVFIKDTNILLNTPGLYNLWGDVGGGFESLAAYIDEIISNEDGTSHLYIFSAAVTLDRLRYYGDDTIVADQEKTIKQVYAFAELGRLENFDNIVPRRERLQKISKLQAGKVDVIEFGRHFSFKLGLKAHYNEDDNDVINMLAQRDNPFFIWINDNTESIMKMYQEPFRFKDLYKVSIIKPDSLRFTKNLYFSGIDDSINMIEVY